MSTPVWNPTTAMSDVATGAADTVLPAYEAILGSSPLAHYDDGQGSHLWGVFSYDEVEKAVADPAAFSNVTVPAGTPRILLLMSDPPEHSPYKRLFTSCFRADRIAEVERQMRSVAGEMIDAMVTSGDADLGAESPTTSPVGRCAR